MDNEKMQRVNRQSPCPVCKKSDWCLVAPDGSAAICARVQEGSIKRCGEAGWLHQLNGLKPISSGQFATPSKPKLIATYNYTDMTGRLLYQVCRFEPKTFRQRRPDGSGGWIWNMDGTPRVLYRLLALLKADPDQPVFIVEGEKDTDRLASLGLVVTTNAGGATKWNTISDDSALHGRKLLILPDNDKSGRNHAEQVAEALQGKVREIKIIELPGLPPKGDVSDWLGAGHCKDELLELVERVCPYELPRQSEVQALNRIMPFRPFPVDILPEPVRSFVNVAARAIGCDTSYIALPLLSAMASAIGNSRRIQLKRGWTEPAVIWTAVVGESGTMKSPAVEAPLKPIIKKQTEAIRQFQQDMKNYLVEEEIYKVDLADWKKKGRKNGEPPPEQPGKPVCQRLWCSDTTVEALADRLMDTPRGLLLVRDELAGWLESFNQYKGGHGGDSAHWLSMHGAKPLLVDRKSGDKTTIYVPRAAVCITGGIQPNILRRVLGKEHFDNGLAARLLLAMPQRKAKTWTNDDIPEVLEIELAEIFDRLIGLEPNTLLDDDPSPVDIPLTPEGQKAFIKFYNAHNAEQMGLCGEEAAAWSKLEGYAARLALVIHYVRWAADDPTLKTWGAIDEQSVAAGAELSRWFGHEVQRVYVVLQEGEQDRNLRRLRELIERKGGQVTVRNWQRVRHHKTAEDARTELATLAEADLGRLEMSKASSSGGRPSEYFTLCDSVTGDKTPYEEPETEVMSLSQVSQDEKSQGKDEHWGVL